MKIHLLLGLIAVLAGALFAAGGYCTDDYDCGYNEYCEYGKCVSYDDYGSYGSSGSCCCGGLILPLGAIGLFVSHKYLN
ncbi:MAG: hypothetical protein N3H30_02965, partial [Candidatus Micrarchaeota archaeon]|nr:hypothetical protein [Candidatus Micrarchaeota archaeon]